MDKARTDKLIAGWRKKKERLSRTIARSKPRLVTALMLLVTLFYVFIIANKPEHVVEAPSRAAPLEKRSAEAEAPLSVSLGCVEREAAPRFGQRGDFWVLYNYVRAERRAGCAAAVTYTTHADPGFLEANLAPLVRRWRGPVSVALFAPGTDFEAALDAVQRARSCGPDAALVRRYTTFHFYFPSRHMPPKQVVMPARDGFSHLPLVSCSGPPRVANASYRRTRGLLYPVNVGRNVAREEATTHFVLASDIELYPSPGLGADFLRMVRREPPSSRRPRVYPLHLFEVKADAPVPQNKSHLLRMLRAGDAIPFHQKVCATCHAVPKALEWTQAADEQTEEGLRVFNVGERTGRYVHWEPIYVGTHAEPEYDERLTWEGRNDKMTQGYAMCLLGYEFGVLDNAFLVHRPGIKVFRRTPDTERLVNETEALVRQRYRFEIERLYGTRKECAIAF